MVELSANAVLVSPEAQPIVTATKPAAEPLELSGDPQPTKSRKAAAPRKRKEDGTKQAKGK